jgi:YggT family protein
MLLLKFIVDFLIVLMLLRLLIKPNEAFSHPIYRLVFRITDPVLTPSRYITRTPTQGVLLTTAGLVVLRGVIYVSMASLPLLAGVGRSFLDLFQLLFQAYMVMWVLAVVAGRGYGTSLIHVMARAFLPIDSALGRMGIPRSRFNIAAFFFLWILYALLNVAALSLMILQAPPTPLWLVHELGQGLLLLIGLFPLPGFFSLVIIVGALLSWVSPDPYNPIVQTIYGISEPLLAPFRRFVPGLGGIDISPIVALVAFQLLGALAQQLVVGLMKAMQLVSLG